MYNIGDKVNKLNSHFFRVLITPDEKWLAKLSPVITFSPENNDTCFTNNSKNYHSNVRASNQPLEVPS